MVTQTDIPSDLTDDDKAIVFQILDGQLNSGILYALLYGIYTGILAVALWNISINKCWTIRRAVVVVIILLYALISINVAANWSRTRITFIENGQNYWTVYLILDGTNAATWVMNIAASISIILADLYMIWCCWMVWGRRWLVILLPISSLVAAIVSRTMTEYYNKVNLTSPLWNVFYMLYLSSNLVTTLSCTLLIIYRILAVAGVRHGAVGRLGVYRCFIEVLVESSALYSISLILDLAFAIHNDFTWYYFDTIAAIAKGVAPTLLVGRAAAGHTLPREESDGSTVSSLHFQTPSELGTTSSQLEESTVQSSVLAMDIEAQPEWLVVSVEQDTVVSTTSQAVISD
ncbi:hypothetical protein ARMSODRAFT_1017633 [Armillaria solidipes]|uniref:Family A G protein-coupled receptor-like protein n=1 Tax=Armillaria solidipes TaxID=1076256 RepID=A0A2H3BJ15_9AGAR|nr:hypothetical protein ARMSODRAFT_1017633 [Armillaria solidipes]